MDKSSFLWESATRLKLFWLMLWVCLDGVMDLLRLRLSAWRLLTLRYYCFPYSMLERSLWFGSQRYPIVNWL
jgi:hypothetical protein